MEKKKDAETKDIVLKGVKDAAISGGVAAAGAALVSATPAGILVAGITGAAPGVFDRIGDLWKGRAERRKALFIEAYLRAADVQDPGVVEAELRADGIDPGVQQVVIEGARAIDETLVDRAVPALARLTREYRSQSKKADAFFRGMRRLLSDLDDGEFAVLDTFLRTVLALEKLRERQTFVELAYDTFGGEVPELRYNCPAALQPLVEGATRQPRWEPLGAPIDPLRLFYLFRSYGLGQELKSGGIGAGAGPGFIRVEFSTVERILEIVSEPLGRSVPTNPRDCGV